MPRAMLFDAESVKKVQKTMMTPSFNAKEFSIPKTSERISPVTGVSMPTVVIMAAK